MSEDERKAEGAARRGESASEGGERGHDAPARDAPARRKKQRVEGAVGSAAETLPGAGTPEGEALREAVVAFEIGDYARVRALTAELVRASDPAVADAAAALAHRVAVDPLQIAFLVACAVALAAIAWFYVLS
jgi:hypothetical protein